MHWIMNGLALKMRGNLLSSWEENAVRKERVRNEEDAIKKLDDEKDAGATISTYFNSLNNIKLN